MDFFRHPSAPHETSITVQTRIGHSIPNYQSHEFSPFEQNLFTVYDRKYSRVNFRTAFPNPIYNCHGLTFAARRTCIIDNKSLQTILEDDGYTEIPKERVLPGDVILYYGPEGDIEHSGIVIAMDQQYHLPQVVSKWGRFKEAIHWGNDCPYSFQHVRYFRVTK